MSYQALYRKWRPQKFADVAGQQHITRTLQNAMLQEKFSHAYLFTGPRGTGKTSAAKIFAKAINCEHQPAKEPCNECAACCGIQDGSIADVIEIDAASNTSVDDIREIRDKVKYAPSAVAYKVYIIDEVHMISTSAFNALLKTLEEPPKHVVFILATTEPHKIPLTIISRCQRFDFKPISNQAIIERMKYIVQAENITVTDDALDGVALAAEGGMRDALSILDQAISYSDENVELTDVLAVTGGVSQGILTQITDSMFDKDMQQALKLLDELIQNGKDPGRFVYDMIYFLRDALLYKSAPNLADILERAMLDDAFKELAEKLSNHWIQDAIMQLNQCQQEMKWTNNPKVFIEITMIAITNRYQQSNNESSVDDAEINGLKNKLSQLEQQLEQLKKAPVQTSEITTETRRRPTRQTKNNYKIPYEKVRMCLQDAQKQALKHVQGEWANFLGKLKAQSAPAHATVQDSKPVAASEKSVVVAFKYEIHCSLFADNRQMVEGVLASVIQKEPAIIAIPINDWKELRNEYVKDHENASTEEQTTQQEEDPFIAEARKLAGDDLLQIHD